MFYMVTMPAIIKRFYKDCVWEMDKSEKAIYLTFDDGPCPKVTDFVLNELARYNAAATFFCIGENVVKHIGLYKKILGAGHAVGNHTYTHVNGWQVNDKIYLDEIKKAWEVIDSNLFRPPYGKFKRTQLKKLQQLPLNLVPVMWSVISGDFDVSISPQQCTNNVINNAGTGAIVVFHDSEKAYKNLKVALPKTLAFFAEKGYNFAKLVL
ncbi:MAG: polysaccharide deacetylase family protein [Ferruginibacter sp.]